MTRNRKQNAMDRVAEVEKILRRWDPIGVAPGSLAPADEYDSYAPPIVSMIARGCSKEELCEHLGVVRNDEMGVPEDPMRDREIADDIIAALRDKW